MTTLNLFPQGRQSAPRLNRSRRNPFCVTPAMAEFHAGRDKFASLKVLYRARRKY
jgi:hypothetical protein